ncbi:19715_t:CDS:2 [Gigaspora margarita]|uniref:19715_t:CDS:1 n=1 Tax=Gigaspora margarita TaxID=4874 RepID=A0ABN7UK58_GIGMA|nr:19715_t:CDS:2 [Gigaspora margarita]
MSKSFFRINGIQGENLNEKLNDLQKIIDERESLKDQLNRYQKNNGKDYEFDKKIERSSIFKYIINGIQGENLNEKLNELHKIIDEKESLKDQLNRYQKTTEKTTNLIRKLSDEKR